MNPELADSLSLGFAAAALFVAGLQTLRASLRTRQSPAPRQAGESPGRGRRAAVGRDPAASGAATERAQEGEHADVGRSPRTEGLEVPAARREGRYDPRPLEDTARRRIAYLLIALLALHVVGLLTMVVFGVISVGEVKEFGVIVAPLVTLVAAATSFYYASRRK